MSKWACVSRMESPSYLQQVFSPIWSLIFSSGFSLDLLLLLLLLAADEENRLKQKDYGGNQTF